RRQRSGPEQHAGPERPGPAAAGFPGRLERQRGRGTGRDDRDAARLRDELEGHLHHRPDAAVREQQPVNERRFMMLAAGIAAAWLLAGCATTGSHEDFSATWPEELPRDAPANGAIYQTGYDVPLFENVVAHRVGDTVTNILSEQTAAQKSASTSTT